MMVAHAHMGPESDELPEYWNGVVDISRSPSPTARPAKRARSAEDDGLLGATPDSLGQSWIENGIIDEGLLEGLDGSIGDDFLFDLDASAAGSFVGYAGQPESSQGDFLSNDSVGQLEHKAKMQTGCIPCL